MAKIVKPGDKVELLKLGSKLLAATGQKEKYMSQVMEAIDENLFKIAMPVSGGRTIPLDEGAIFNATIYSGADLYSADVRIENRGKEGNIFFLIVKLLTKLQKIQRRQYYRLECLLEFKYSDKLEESDIWLEGTIVDISGGGLRFVSKNKMNINEDIACKLILKFERRIEEILVKGIVISSTLNESNLYETRIEFKNIEQPQRELIIKFIFEEERKRRSKK